MPVTVAEFRCTDTTGGGPDKTILFSAAGHDPERVRIVPFFLTHEGDPLPGITAFSRESGVEAIRVPDRSKLDLRLLPDMRRRLRKHGCDLIHTHDFKTDFWGLVLARTTPGLGLMATAHGWSNPLAPSHRFFNALDRRVLRAFPLVIAVSEATAEKLAGMKIRPERIEVLPNGIDLEAWSPRPRPDPLPPGLPAGGRFIGTVGRLSIDKAVDTLIEAFAVLAPGRPDLHLVLVGDGPERERLEALAAARGVAARTLFLGHRADLRDLYAAFDLFALSSRTEGMPNTLLEALAMARPVVATPVGGVGEVVRDRREAILVPPGQTAPLAEALSEVLDSEILAASLSQAGRRRVEACYSFAARLDRLETLYERVAGIPERGSGRRGSK